MKKHDFRAQKKQKVENVFSGMFFLFFCTKNTCFFFFNFLSICPRGVPLVSFLDWCFFGVFGLFRGFSMNVGFPDFFYSKNRCFFWPHRKNMCFFKWPSNTPPCALSRGDGDFPSEDVCFHELANRGGLAPWRGQSHHKKIKKKILELWILSL